MMNRYICSVLFLCLWIFSFEYGLQAYAKKGVGMGKNTSNQIAVVEAKQHKIISEAIQREKEEKDLYDIYGEKSFEQIVNFLEKHIILYIKEKDIENPSFICIWGNGFINSSGAFVVSNSKLILFVTDNNTRISVGKEKVETFEINLSNVEKQKIFNMIGKLKKQVGFSKKIVSDKPLFYCVFCLDEKNSNDIYESFFFQYLPQYDKNSANLLSLFKFFAKLLKNDFNDLTIPEHLETTLDGK